MILGNFFNAKMTVPSGWNARIERDRAAFIDGISLEQTDLIHRDGQDPVPDLV